MEYLFVYGLFRDSGKRVLGECTYCGRANINGKDYDTFLDNDERGAKLFLGKYECNLCNTQGTKDGLNSWCKIVPNV